MYEKMPQVIVNGRPRGLLLRRKTEKRIFYRVRLPGTKKRADYPLKIRDEIEGVSDPQVALALAVRMYEQAWHKAIDPMHCYRIHELLDQYLESIKRVYTETEYRRKRGLLLNHLADYVGQSSVDFTPAVLKAWREGMIAKNLGVSTINAVHTMILQMFRWAAEEEMFDADCYQKLTVVAKLQPGRCAAKPPRKVHGVPDGHVLKTLEYARPVLAAMIRLQWLTGMRGQEVRLMRGCDIDMSGQIWLYRPSEYKEAQYKEDKIVPLGPKAQEVIRPFLKTRTDACLFTPRQSERNRRGRQPKGLRDHYTADTYRRAIQYTINRANRAIKADAKARGIDRPDLIPVWTPHQLRHSAATRFKREFGLEAARAMLGHSQVNMTEHYAEMDLRKAMQVASKIG